MNLTRSAKLKVLSSLLTNFAAGLILILPAISDFWVLTGNVLFAIVCMLLAMKMETVLGEEL